MTANLTVKQAGAQRAADVVTVPMVGPGQPARCVKCGQLIAEGEHWRKMTRDGYSVGVHDRCPPAGQAA